MKKNGIYSVIITLCLYSFTIVPSEQPSFQKAYALVFDMDEVFADLNRPHVLLQSLWYLASNPRTLFALLTTDVWKKFATLGKSSFSTYHMGKLAQEYPYLQQNFDHLMQICHGQRTMNLSVIKLLAELKDQHYTLIVATNRDRMAYEITAQTLGLNTLYHGKPLFDHVIVARESNYKKATTSLDGNSFSHLSFTIPAGTISSIPTFKPNPLYYQKMRTIVDTLFEKNNTPSPTILFFDDNKKNIESTYPLNLNIKGFVVPAKNRAESIEKNIRACGIPLPLKPTTSSMMLSYIKNIVSKLVIKIP